MPRLKDCSRPLKGQKSIIARWVGGHLVNKNSLPPPSVHRWGGQTLPVDTVLKPGSNNGPSVRWWGAGCSSAEPGSSIIGWAAAGVNQAPSQSACSRSSSAIIRARSISRCLIAVSLRSMRRCNLAIGLSNSSKPLPRPTSNAIWATSIINPSHRRSGPYR